MSARDQMQYVKVVMILCSSFFAYGVNEEKERERVVCLHALSSHFGLIGLLITTFYGLTYQSTLTLFQERQ